MLPAASRAIALSVWEPLSSPRVSQTTEYGLAVSSAPRFWLSTRNWTPATPWLSLAFAVTVTSPLSVAPPAGDVTETVGAVVSAVTAALASFDEAPMLPAASSAVTL